MAAENVVLTWSVTNWVTVVLMALVGFALFAVALKAVNRAKGSEQNA